MGVSFLIQLLAKSKQANTFIYARPVFLEFFWVTNLN